MPGDLTNIGAVVLRRIGAANREATLNTDSAGLPGRGIRTTGR